MPNGTGKVAYNSDLKRKSWAMQGLIQKSATSFWAPYKGSTLDSIIMVENDISKKQGHEVIFDFKGALSGKPVKGNTQAKGTGEQKKKFSDKVRVSDYRYVVDNGTKFDGVDIGDLSINEHSESRNMLGDLWVRSEDQAFFDLAQQTPEFGITLTTSTFDDLLGIEEVVKSGTGFTDSPTGISTRAPLKPFKLQNGDPVFLWLVDVSMKKKLLGSAGMQNMLSSTDIRGNDNRLIKGVLGRVGNFLFVEASTFFGTTEGAITTDGYYNYDNTGVELAGLRKYDATNDAWSGTAGYDPESKIITRSVILGAGAFQKANGMAPDYKYEETDFGKFSESCLEVWCGAKATKLLVENEDNKYGKLGGYNYGSVFVDIEI